VALYINHYSEELGTLFVNLPYSDSFPIDTKVYEENKKKKSFNIGHLPHAINMYAWPTIQAVSCALLPEISEAGNKYLTEQ
jgi:hypothetical protein